MVGREKKLYGIFALTSHGHIVYIRLNNESNEIKSVTCNIIFISICIVIMYVVTY